MKSLDFYLSCVSPEAYLAFERLPEALAGLSYCVRYLPVLQGDLSGGGEVLDGTRFARCAAQAQAWGITLKRPSALNVDERPWAELAWAQARQGAPNRFVVEAVLRQLWGSDLSEQGPAPWQDLAARLQHEGAEAGQEDLQPSKDVLHQVGEQAKRAGVQAVPAWVLDGQVFHGLAALPALRQHLAE